MAKQDYKKIELSPKYTPKKSEPYMCPEHLAYFYQLLNLFHKLDCLVTNFSDVQTSFQVRNAE